ncbi:aromatic aminobenezylarsenical efflux permease ArsG family transporter [Flavobacterium taihuense]|uniref:Sulfite exporter TauE/SafE family protein n=1 Tax=Flavobacterium taihuense TaxID=2857508 RepID=A0ABS6XW96_9FLAO|nr:aromatic aminobenezylarsenical efflux permease ArsG family transporter [Flavobacterium taihuense]MBW4360950.1 sulfite exporter TauE/SafE family protein [Flavobacterium taihuense]
MEWLNQLAQNNDVPLLTAFALGLLTAISPCPLATNITATAYIAKTVNSKYEVILSGLLYAFGRVFTYTSIGTLVYFGFSKFQVAKLLQGNGEKLIGPVMIVIGFILLDVIKLNFLSNINLTEKLSEKFRTQGIFGSFLLGALFALAFCPYSGALFFGMLIPMTLSANEGLALPIVFALGTGLPVLFFAFVIAFSLEKLGKYFHAIRKVEKVMRLIAGFTFIVTGVYYINIYLKIIG